MGTSASVGVNISSAEQNKRSTFLVEGSKKTAAIHEVPSPEECLKAIMSFTEIAYNTCPVNETFELIMSDSKTRNVFIKFLKTEKKGHIFKFLRLESISENNEISERAVPLTHIPINNPNPAPDVVQLLRGERDFTGKEITQILSTSRNETVVLLVMEALPRFLASDFFKEWQIAETQNVKSFSSHYRAGSISLNTYSRTRLSRSVSRFSEQRGSEVSSNYSSSRDSGTQDTELCTPNVSERKVSLQKPDMISSGIFFCLLLLLLSCSIKLSYLASFLLHVHPPSLPLHTLAQS